MNYTYVRLYADPDGESHFEDVPVTLESVDFAPPAPPLYLAPVAAASQFSLLGADPDWFGDWHPTPRRQAFCTLTGEYEVTTSDGVTRHFGPGTVLLLEDTHGKGHATRMVGGGPMVLAATGRRGL